MFCLLSDSMHFYEFFKVTFFCKMNNKHLMLVYMIPRVALLLEEAKSPNQEIGLGKEGQLKVLNATKLILND